MIVRWTLDIPKEQYEAIKEIAFTAEVPITSVVKEILRQKLQKEVEHAD